MKITVEWTPNTDDDDYDYIAHVHKQFALDETSTVDQRTVTVYTFEADLPDKIVQENIEMIRKKTGLVPTPEQFRDIAQSSYYVAYETLLATGDTVQCEYILDALTRHLTVLDHWPSNHDTFCDPKLMEHFGKALYMGAYLRGWAHENGWADDEPQTVEQLKDEIDQRWERIKQIEAKTS